MSNTSLPKIAFQMDQLDSIDITVDSTFLLALEAQQRKLPIFHFLPQNLFYKNGKLFVYASRIKLFPNQKPYFTQDEPSLYQISDFDFVLIRQDPPFDLSYITNTHLLELAPAHVKVVNNPAGIRNCPEKLLVTKFHHLMPPTLITNLSSQIYDFSQTYKQTVIKPLYGNGGNGVFFLSHNDPNLNVIIETMLDIHHTPLMIQQFIPQIKNGDKRIILIDGNPVGAIKRIPQKYEIRSNLHVGGHAQHTTLNENDLSICNEIAPALKEFGLFLSGIDVIHNFLTEINVTSPTGLVNIHQLSGVNLAKTFWDKLLH